MSGKLDQSLDEIVSSHRRSGAGRGRADRRVRTPRQATKSAPAPVGGIKKNPRHAKGAVKAIPTGPSGGNGESRIQVSNLPRDVNENQIKEYFVKSVGPIKKVDISYGPGGVSRGIATISFVRSDGASKAVEALNGLLVDGKPMKIDVILDAQRAAAIPPPKGLGERIAQPKAQPKSAAIAKSGAVNGAAGGRGGKGKRGRGGARNPGRPTKKTAEELDSEMVDYWNTGAATAEGDGAATSGDAPAANGDAPMDDEIL